MQKPLQEEYKPYFKQYIDLVPDGNFIDLFRQNSADTIKFFESIPTDKHNYCYIENKWTVKEILMHIIDTERVMSYRSLVAIRGDDKTPLHNMDENMYAANVDVTNRTMDNLVSEFKAVRSSTEKLFENVTEEQSKFMADGVTHPVTARALGYVMIGHIKHHIRVIKERYL